MAEDPEVKKYTYISGAVYEGTFSGRQREGRGHWSHPDGDVYEGEYHENKQNGLGVYIFGKTGKRYVGNWKNGSMDGKGVFFFLADNSVFYCGEYEKDEKHGSGFYMYEQGVLTVQTWEHGTMVTETEATPLQRVECQLLLDELLVSVRAVSPRELGGPPTTTEPRVFQFPSGASYTGQYLNTKKHGQGYWVHPEGDSYEGMFNQNKHCGWGLYVIGRSGKKYLGYWDSGKMNGVGVYFFNPQETEYFVGTYKNDAKNGRGVYHFAENSRWKLQTWDNGELKNEVNADEQTIEQYKEAIQKIIEIVKPYAPHYEQVAQF